MQRPLMIYFRKANIPHGGNYEVYCVPEDDALHASRLPTFHSNILPITIYSKVHN